ncbi:GTP cyclohydrolase I FolE [Lentilactobacillus hilgardii]|jgi:GTP cyclohydrolase I|uniref:GTP cyclohydrolase I FolE n=1 Tax=Lentilactobacillus hilgardii TaxID=1588 RepID=UPI00019C5B22|nr:GTP cyclohydrolase I FolE [Lentilactobacillus hilgardii]EEI18560.1 GTP cyclohydrolase I [Lentilactobacillus buchneri ATCC 11577]MCT3397326.1 GTP cyclohydrolase I FolE [Lentilactobacillus hilgardii]QIR09480.1 GTP cyclohydrolase 1 [Lentilactobacillus hilgardii]
MKDDIVLSLGSNIGNREFYINKAIQLLGNDANILIDKVSNFYETSPVGNVKQRHFVNIALKIATTYTPEKLLAVIHQVELSLHRTREIHWGPRTLDIDIIFWGDKKMSTDDLTIPHPETFNRLFVLVPILEIISKQFPFYQQISKQIQVLQKKDQTVSLIKKDAQPKRLVESSIHNILSAIGDDPDRPGLVETPDRVARMYDEIFSSEGLENFEDYKLFKSKSSNHSKMVLMKNIPFYSMCEHHMMPFWGKAHIAYIPDHGTIIGLSKIPRLVDFVSHKLGLQEKLTDDIVDQLNKILAPKGAAVVIDARHMCVEMRGVKKTDSSTRTIRFSGIFDTDQDLQMAFLNSIGDINGKSI